MGRTGHVDADIGNARPAVVFDVLERVLERRLHARELTDAADRIGAAAHADLAALGLRPPGWHSENQGPGQHHHGRPIDLLGGGSDLPLPQDEDGIAQGPHARLGIQSGPVTVDGRKMSKSLGNVVLIRDLLTNAPGEAVRLALLSVQHRQPLGWTAQTLPQAVRALTRFYAVIGDGPKGLRLTRHSPLLSRFRAALDDDLNTPAALAELGMLANAAQAVDARLRPRYVAALVEGGAELGLLQKTEGQWLAECAATGAPQGQTPPGMEIRHDTRPDHRADPRLPADRFSWCRQDHLAEPDAGRSQPARHGADHQ